VNKDNVKIAVIGLGYVGLPLANEFGKIIDTIGYDLSEARVRDLKVGVDSTLEVSKEELALAKNLSFTNESIDLIHCNVFIVTVPTPIDSSKKPDLSPLKKASETIGKILKVDDIVIYESTVYPGATEDYCVPILEKESNLRFNEDFYCGYSPERINPGDKKHMLTSIKKITSGSTPEVAEKIDALYNQIISAGTYKAQNIKIAEAAKVIENTQRDVNIALINELAMIFNKLDIDTQAVLKAASTKWNFLEFWPGLVGGHCIGVDPYYLTHKALSVGYNPEIILAGRKINDNMANYIVNQVISLMGQKNISVENSNILVMGLTFKENCPDLRNTKVIDLINLLREKSCNVDVCDPWVDEEDMISYYSISNSLDPKKGNYDAIILAVAHTQFTDMNFSEIRSFGKKKCVIYDVKYLFEDSDVDGRL